jgi:hypothetical protein
MLVWLLSLLGIGSATTAAAIFFPGFGLALAAFGKAALSWLSKRSLGEIAGIAAVLAFAVMILVHLADKRENGKLETQLASAVSARDNYKHQLDALSSKKNEQAVVTKTNIVTVTRTIHDADEQAKKVETAPVAPNCGTPKLVLDADI